MKGVLAAGLSVGLAAAVVGTAVLTSAVSLLGVGSGAPAASSAATAQIPPAMLTLYQEGAATCPGLPWTILAAIGTVESDNGQSNLPGVHSGANAAGAEGPMQFEPGTFAAYDEPVPPGGANPPSPYDPTDAVYAAARLLCADGAAGGADLSGAVYAYNHSTSYVAQVLALAQTYAASSPATTADTGSSDSAGCRGGVVGAGADRHALRLGWRDAGYRLRLLGTRAGRLRRGRRVTPPGGPGPVRRHFEARCRGSVGAGRPGVLRWQPGFHRPRRPVTWVWSADRT